MPGLFLRRLLFALIALLCILYLSALGISMARGLTFGRALSLALMVLGREWNY